MSVENTNLAPNFDNLLVVQSVSLYGRPKEEGNYTLGFILEEQGDLGVITREVPLDHPRMGYFDVPAMTLAQLRAGIEIDLLQGPGRKIARAIGFDSVTEYTENAELAQVATFPTAGYANSAVRTLYQGIGKEPPFIFVKHPGGDGGRFTGKEYIECLAQGRVLVSAPENLSYSYHDLKDHLLGYVRIDPVIAGIIKDKAKSLVDNDQLDIDDNGWLTVMEARRLASYTDQMSNYLTKYNSDDKLNPFSFNVSKMLEAMLDGTSPRRSKIRHLKNAIMEHQVLLEETAEDLRTAA